LIRPFPWHSGAVPGPYCCLFRPTRPEIARHARLEYTIRRKVFSFLGQKFHVYDSTGKLLGFCQQAAFKLKEDIRVYSDETKTDERVVIKARSIIDFGAAYDVYDSKQGQQKVGALKRKGWSSMLRDSWIVMDAQDREIGKIRKTA
jgi:hypothetical protein